MSFYKLVQDRNDRLSLLLFFIIILLVFCIYASEEQQYCSNNYFYPNQALLVAWLAWIIDYNRLFHSGQLPKTEGKIGPCHPILHPKVDSHKMPVQHCPSSVQKIDYLLNKIYI